ncbi:MULTISPECIES: EamA family transporter [unclassified Streptomyces]|nr:MULTISPECIES: EamA family transporter [unclassified Streptomyces]MYR66546.1 EamA family transporter [Streptomyces sp. SID4939]MYR99581.1 EamA family transporter [Streptomyces sp. SID4940]MYT61818.1 EamA family transporter [Streptomyces sp. SID8357]MYT85188.1 EamA family transporter [Streptomyces sp. SID8360]MYU36299.1 EamA family transporter [Streptomyces sp. SID8358]MYW39117.1 EamA family transporter [Streptomyces sp. SID1]
MNDSRSAAEAAAVGVPEAVATLDGAGHGGPARPGARRAALGPVALVVAGGLSVQFGAAVAVLLMPKAGALGVVTLRLAAAALVLLAVCRPALRGHSRADWGTVVAFGVAMGGMNTLFYQAADRIPLGVAVTLEVLGPLVLSVVASRRLLNLVWAGLALGGVVLLSGGGFDRLDMAGAAFALGAGVMWAAYIVFSARTGRRFPQADGLALAMAVAAVLSLPLGIMESGSKLVVPTTLGLGAAVALLSSVLPYTLELMALRRLPAPTFAVLMSLEPAIAAMAGFLVLDQALSTTDALAIALVVGASIGAVRATTPRGTMEKGPKSGRRRVRGNREGH